ncbi:EscU/YscU/HrcU family type III secretion system export apparatus switch protein [Geobacillus sp. DSP4a]|uniref:EscU/YscU/HrcU family type III secretion system export apparatus switch protein n=1 Tax=Geobacillus sp. DSP4a TaxID=2508873 RepID=UPI0007AB236C|nr:EscU/YscU/HrcU family type III secretion system export apparatus switch protein [Geobacillus sp. DSP4a]NNU99388.1 flagellar biosynthesis protein FlhS [Geobacillus sp. DSP4a]
MMTAYFNQKKRKQMNGPTAAVIRYDETSGQAPTVVAQGSGHVAQKIIELAEQHHVHIQEDPLLVQHLVQLDLGDRIPPQLYAVIAEILILIEEIEKNY